MNTCEHDNVIHTRYHLVGQSGGPQPRAGEIIEMPLRYSLELVATRFQPVQDDVISTLCEKEQLRIVPVEFAHNDTHSSATTLEIRRCQITRTVLFLLKRVSSSRMISLSPRKTKPMSAAACAARTKSCFNFQLLITEMLDRTTRELDGGSMAPMSGSQQSWTQKTNRGWHHLWFVSWPRAPRPLQGHRDIPYYRWNTL